LSSFLIPLYGGSSLSFVCPAETGWLVFRGFQAVPLELLLVRNELRGISDKADGQ